MCKIPEDCFQPFNAVYMCSSILYICMYDLSFGTIRHEPVRDAQRRRRRGLTQWCIGTSSHRARIICTGGPGQRNHQHCLLSQIAAWLDDLDLAQDVTCLTHGSLPFAILLRLRERNADSHSLRVTLYEFNPWWFHHVNMRRTHPTPAKSWFTDCPRGSGPI